jgi:hypothetical protein
MSKMSNFAMVFEEFKTQAVGLTREEVMGLAIIYFPEEFERAYALQQFNPEHYGNMNVAQLLTE